jgi:hypothetical protein
VLAYENTIGLRILEEDGGIKAALNIDYAGLPLRLPVIEKDGGSGLLATLTDFGYAMILLYDDEVPDTTGNRNLFIPYEDVEDDIVLLHLSDIKISKSNGEGFSIKNSNCGYHLGWESTILMKKTPEGCHGYVVDVLYRDGHYIIPLMQAPKGRVDGESQYNRCWDVQYDDISVLISEKL